MRLRFAVTLACLLAGVTGSYAQPARDVAPSAQATPAVSAPYPAPVMMAAAAGASLDPVVPQNDRAETGDRPGAFDYFLLSLSWSPSYCAADGTQKDTRQCRAARPYAFIVHGLWPQAARSAPDFCQTPAPYVPDETIDAMGDIMPSKGLILHQWRKHGTCTGLSPEHYFALVRRAYEKVTIPDAFAAPRTALRMTAQEVEAAFRTANPALGGDMIAVDCKSDRLREVRICFSKDLAFTSCPETDRRGCALRRVLDVPAPQ